VTRKVVVMEDDRDSNYLICYLLGRLGYEVSSAYEAAQGVELVAQERPDLILMDLHMTPIGGLEAARMLEANSELRDIPRIAVTAYAMVGRREQVLAAGFAGYISKPIDATQFVDQVERILAERLRPGGGHTETPPT
jgi:CheY-like chemotaxis protein